MENRGKHSFKAWLLATRPWSFPASAMPVLVTLAYLFWMGHKIDWLAGVWALVNIVIFHAAGNTWSDYFDYKKGVDREDAIGGMSIVSGEFKASEIKALAWVLLFHLLRFREKKHFPIQTEQNLNRQKYHLYQRGDHNRKAKPAKR